MSNIPKQTHYEALGISPDATESDIRKAFYRVSLEKHPDKKAGHMQSQQIHEEYVVITSAYDILKDANSRAKYDASLPKRRQEHRAKPSSNTKYQQYNDRKGWSQPPRTSRSQEMPYEYPTTKDEGPSLSPDDSAFLRYRIAKNKLEGLSFSLRDVLQTIRGLARRLGKFPATKSRCIKIKVRLQPIDALLTNLVQEMDMLMAPALLRADTVSVIERLVELEGRMRVLIASLGTSSAMTEDDATRCVKLIMREMNSWTTLA